jgi:hypothetical protein
MQLLAGARAATARGIKQCNYTVGLKNIADALISSGYTSLDQQAKALGLPRSTAWTIVHAKHKVDRLSAKVSARMLENPRLPPLVRATLQQYLAERSAVAARAMAPVAGSVALGAAADSG